MLFNDFIKYIPKIEKETLLSTDAHAKMAPLERISYLKEENCTYRCCDLYMEDVDEICDITHMKCYEDLRFDYVICSHVLEHVHDDMKAVKEIFRILKVNGKALILVPIPIDQKEAVYDPSILDSNDRIRFFGQEDHVRMYSSKSLNNLLTGAGFWCNHWLSKDWNVNNMRIGLTETSKLYIGIKK